jgi:hypothetical protein
MCTEYTASHSHIDPRQSMQVQYIFLWRFQADESWIAKPQPRGCVGKPVTLSIDAERHSLSWKQGNWKQCLACRPVVRCAGFRRFGIFHYPWQSERGFDLWIMLQTVDLQHLQLRKPKEQQCSSSTFLIGGEGALICRCSTFLMAWWTCLFLQQVSAQDYISTYSVPTRYP